MLLAEVSVSPQSNAILPPFTSKVGKTMLKNPPVTVSVSPLKRRGEYLIKMSKLPIYLQAEEGEIYKFEVGGKEEEVIKVLSNLESREIFNAEWRVVDVNISKVKVTDCNNFELIIGTPALLVDPWEKTKRKRFTNRPSVVFFTNILEVKGITREMASEFLNLIDSSLWEEPSNMTFRKVYYEDKEVVGLYGKLRYSICRSNDLVKEILENAIARGIGSSRKNGFGRVEVRCL
ncbi:CRISPR-associated endoribonuclease Cas6 [Acidianus sp. RZ1]|uniref:CRISPR-associated endoribonuclease Cas6 n=1 Tax=Acidianus sp. RZ1 TaxID=1540082 RepID=UPI001491F7D7|nr:CRISPR-associated endoribonuclease Cas6 [Acidianus sp. RZ1]NON61616.1 CRISPR-associated endoribonuclease Cas6 [Acidianus sp. RZ1]